MKTHKPFDSLAPYYDLTYKSKSYDRESAAIHRFIQKTLKKRAGTLLDLGCGTGGHIQFFAHKGYVCTGVDTSKKMTTLARKKLAPLVPRPTIIQADLKQLRLTQKFDVVTSLFHVLSYMTTEKEVNAFFQTIRRHLAPGGVCIFDCWDEKKVLASLPEIRYKEVIFPNATLHRIKIPTLHAAKKTVTVVHQGFLVPNGRSSARHFTEQHVLRYFSVAKIQHLARRNGLKLLSTKMLNDSVNDAWGTVFAATLYK